MFLVPKSGITMQKTRTYAQHNSLQRMRTLYSGVRIRREQHFKNAESD